MSLAIMTAESIAPQRVSLAELPSITLAEVMSKAALQTRIDRKYLVSADELPEILAEVAEALEVLRIDGQERFGYHSTYFDTADLAAYHLAGQKRRRRFKVRTRVYRSSGDTYLEVKTKGARSVTVKDRTPYELANAGRLSASAQEFVTRTLAARGVPGVDASELLPSLHIGYDRTTLVVEDRTGASRATVDTELKWRRPGSTEALSVPNQVIVETKGGTAPSILDRALWRHGVRPARVSKYGAGLAATDSDLPELKWHRLLNQQLNPVAI